MNNDNTKSKKQHVDLSTILGFVGTLFGCLTTIWASIKTEENGFIILFVLSVVMETIVFSLWTWCVTEHFRYKKNEAKLINENRILVEKNDAIRSEVDEKKKEFENECARLTRCLSIISLSIKNNSIHNNELLVKVPSEGDNSYLFSNIISNSNSIPDEEKRVRLIQDAMNYSNDLFDIYKRYCIDMLEEIIRLETAYIKIRGYSLRISASIKLFDRAYIHTIDNRNSIKVYTAFRDKETYYDKNEQGLPKREIGLRLYTIDGNNDFTDCLTRDVFYINNATRDTNNYINEHEDFDTYYNCTIVVPIRTKMMEGQKKIYGYLCCDCLNDKYDNQEIFDKGAAQYLFAFAQNFATFLETLDANWLDRFYDKTTELPKTAIELIYDKTYKK